MDLRTVMGPYTLIRRLCDPAAAAAAAEVLQAVYRANLKAAKLSVSPFGEVETYDERDQRPRYRFDSAPMVPIRCLAASSGTRRVEALAWREAGSSQWDEDFEVGTDGPVLMAYHDVGSPLSFCTLEDWLDGTFDPARRSPAADGDRTRSTRIEIRANGGQPEAIDAIRSYHRHLRAYDRYWDRYWNWKWRLAREPGYHPPFFDSVLSPESFVRAEHVERRGGGSESSVLEIADGQLRLVLYFENPIVGSRALREWFEQNEFHGIELEIGVEPEHARVGRPAAGAGQIPAPISEILELPDDLSSLDDVAAARIAFDIGPYLEPVQQRLESIPDEELARQWAAHWRNRSSAYWPDQQLVLELVHRAWPASRGWFEEYWKSRTQPDSNEPPLGSPLCMILGHEQAEQCVVRWVETGDTLASRLERLASAWPVPAPRFLELLESEVARLDGAHAPVAALAETVAARQISWQRIESWVSMGAPFDELALHVLGQYNAIALDSTPSWATYRPVLRLLASRYPRQDVRRQLRKNANYTNPCWRFWARDFHARY